MTIIRIGHFDESGAFIQGDNSGVTPLYPASQSPHIEGYILPIMSFRRMSQQRNIAPIVFQESVTISDGKSASFDSQSPLGSSEPFLTYSNSGSRSLGLELSYTAVSRNYNFRWVMQQLARLMALAYPIYQRGNVAARSFSPPPMVLLNYGQRYINVPCKVTDVRFNDNASYPIEMYTHFPLRVDVSLSLTVSYPFGYAPGHDDIAAKWSDADFSGAIGDAAVPQAVSPINEPENYESEAPRPVFREAGVLQVKDRSLEINPANQGLSPNRRSRKLNEITFTRR